MKRNDNATNSRYAASVTTIGTSLTRPLPATWAADVLRPENIITIRPVTPKAQTYGRQHAGEEWPDPWEGYHFLIALLVLIGALAGVASIRDLLRFFEHLNVLEESGLVACLAIVAGKVTRYVLFAAKWLQRLRLL